MSAATAAVAGVASAVAVLALEPAGNAQTTPQDWASGITATGAIPIPATPYVASNGPVMTSSAGSIPSNPALTASLLPVSAGNYSAMASVASLNIGAGQITANLLKAICQNGTGNADLAELKINGQGQDAAVPPNTTVPPPSQLPDVVSITLNKQVPDGHGGLEVTALELTLDLTKLPPPPAGLPTPPSGAPAETIDISTADCAAAPTGTSPTPPPAPAPKPGQGTLPVTG